MGFFPGELYHIGAARHIASHLQTGFNLGQAEYSSGRAEGVKLKQRMPLIVEAESQTGVPRRFKNNP